MVRRILARGEGIAGSVGVVAGGLLLLIAGFVKVDRRSYCLFDFKDNLVRNTIDHSLNLIYSVELIRDIASYQANLVSQQFSSF